MGEVTRDFANQVLTKLVERGNPKEVIDQKLRELDAGGQKAWISESATRLGMAPKNDDYEQGGIMGRVAGQALGVANSLNPVHGVRHLEAGARNFKRSLSEPPTVSPTGIIMPQDTKNPVKEEDLYTPNYDFRHTLDENFPEISKKISKKGESEGELLGILGMIAGPGLAKTAASGLENVASKSGTKALGFLKTELKNAGGLEKAREAANTLVKETDVIRPWKGIEQMGKEVEEVQNKAGKTIGSILSKVDKEGKVTIDPTEVYSSIANTPLREYRGRTLTELAKDLPEVDGELKKLSDRLSRIGKDKANPSATFDEMQYQKQLLRKTINWKESDQAGNAANQAKKVMYYAINQSIDDGLARVGEMLGNSEIGQEFSKAKELYGAASKAEIGINSKKMRTAANKSMSLTDWILAGGGVSAGALAHPEMAAKSLGALAAKKVAERYGWQTLTYGADVGSGILNKVAPAIEKAPPFGLLNTVKKREEEKRK